MTRSLSLRVFLPAIAVLAVACGGKGEAPKVPLAEKMTDSSARAMQEAHALLGPEAKVALDSGNVQFRRKDYEKALASYRHAAELAPQHSAPLFGIVMYAQQTKNKKLLDSATKEIQLRTGPLPAASGDAPHGTSDSALEELRAKMKKGAKAG